VPLLNRYTRGVSKTNISMIFIFAFILYYHHRLHRFSQDFFFNKLFFLKRKSVWAKSKPTNFFIFCVAFSVNAFLKGLLRTVLIQREYHRQIESITLEVIARGFVEFETHFELSVITVRHWQIIQRVAFKVE